MRFGERRGGQHASHIITPFRGAAFVLLFVGLGGPVAQGRVGDVREADPGHHVELGRGEVEGLAGQVFDTGWLVGLDQQSQSGVPRVVVGAGVRQGVEEVRRQNVDRGLQLVVAGQQRLNRRVRC